MTDTDNADGDAPAEPLKPARYFILLAIAHGDRHGYAIRERALELSGGQVKLWPTTLYGSLQELHDAGLIVELDEPRSPEEENGRRRYWELTKKGRRALKVETARLEALVARARALSDA